jgi:hypothetical protein
MSKHAFEKLKVASKAVAHCETDPGTYRVHFPAGVGGCRDAQSSAGSSSTWWMRRRCQV